jgi:hypothetical protein
MCGHAPLIAGRDADFLGVVNQRSRPYAEHRPSARHVIELHHAIRQNERVMVRQRGHARSQADVARARGRGRDEHFGRGDDLETARMMLANPGFVVVEPVEQFDQLQIAFQRDGGVFFQIMERRKENAAAQVSVIHIKPSPRSLL